MKNHTRRHLKNKILEEVKPIIFIGAERVGKAVLKALLKAEKNIVAVFTAHPSLKSKIADYINFSDLEKRFPHVKFHYILNSRDASVIKKIKYYRPEVIYVISWSQIIPTEILRIPSKGVIGLHYSLLPNRRGGAPLNWAIIDGLRETGITLFYMDEGIDTGDIIAQRKLHIRYKDTVKDLLDIIVKIAPSIILKNCDTILRGDAPRIKQDEQKSTYTPRRTPKDSAIDWSCDLEKIYNFIRALVPPYPSAFIMANNKKVLFTSVKKINSKKLKIEGYLEVNE